MVTSFVNYVLIPLAAFCAGILAVYLLFTVIRYCVTVVRECRENKIRSSLLGGRHQGKFPSLWISENCDPADHVFECHSCPHYRECKIRSHETKEY